MNQVDVVKLLQAAQVEPSESTLAALEPHLAQEVEFAGLIGRASGSEATLEALKDSQVAEVLGQAKWSEVTVDGDVAIVTATLAPGAMLGGATISVRFGGEHISAITYQMLPAAPAPASELILSDDLKELVNSALASGNPLLLAYVDPEGSAHLSFRGSTHVWSDTALAVWVRNPEGGLLPALENNAHVTFWYRRSEPITIYQFWGRARVQNDEETREKVYTGSPEAEQRVDAQRRGIPVIVELDRIEGRVGRETVRMERSAGERSG